MAARLRTVLARFEFRVDDARLEAAADEVRRLRAVRQARAWLAELRRMADDCDRFEAELRRVGAVALGGVKSYERLRREAEQVAERARSVPQPDDKR